MNNNDEFQPERNWKASAGIRVGLAIVKKIIDNHNGIIVVKSEVNKGTIFNICIPAFVEK